MPHTTPEQLLMLAIRTGDLKAVKAQRVKVPYPPSEAVTVAALRGHYGILNYLLVNSADKHKEFERCMVLARQTKKETLVAFLEKYARNAN